MGVLIIGVAVIFFFIVMSFNVALEKIITDTCTDGPTCPMHTSLNLQRIISYSLIGLLVLIGAFVTFFMHEKKLPPETKKTLSEEEKKRTLENLNDEEKQVMNLVLREQGSIYQSDLIKDTQLTKVKVTRILDKLEGRGLIERKRRGMTNIVILR